MPRWFLVVSAIAGLGFAVPTVQAVATGDVRTAVVSVIVTGFFCWPLVTWLRYRRDPADSTGPDGLPPEDLTARGARRWLVPVALLVVVAVLGLVPRWSGSLVPLWALVLAAVTVLRLRTGGDEVHFTDDALVVRPRTGVEKRYPWADVLELSWSAPHWLMSGSGPVARISGSAYDTPGPTSPGQLAAVLLAGHDDRLWGRRQVRRVAARHGIPFTDDLVNLVSSGRRPARLPGEHS
ncbi:hypothetical protein AB1207_17170 [Kineococcus endophyticus]|uniref:PH (Pleckstrin Homology) domain-containing protein n=1 Tax=Kineococcus endophyticus TaxID=1181883 RepID=A0ABV3PAF2_9ACTN